MRGRLSPRGHWLVPRSADAWRIDETSWHSSPSIEVRQIPKRGNSTIGGVDDLRLPWPQTRSKASERSSPH